MPIDLDRYKKLKADVDRCQREADRAEGALAQTMERLADEFGCKTLKAAEAKAKKLAAEAEEAEQEFAGKLDEFEEKHGAVLKGE